LRHSLICFEVADIERKQAILQGLKEQDERSRAADSEGEKTEKA
jgi:hypothetical protein